MAYPPTHNKKRTKKSTDVAPNKYPATEENKTLMDKRNLVISKKTCIAERKVAGEYVTDKLIFDLMCKDTLSFKL